MLEERRPALASIFFTIDSSASAGSEVLISGGRICKYRLVDGSVG